MSSWHVVWLGAHMPVHAPPTHVWFVHADCVTQLPVGPHVCGLLPEHCICPGPHTPWQTPAPTHVWFVHVTGGVLHWPVAPHVSTPLFTHCLLSTAQTPWHEAVLPLRTHV
jgi:hypothetical protein